MPATLTLNLLGRPAFLLDGRELPCVSRKALWMAAYVMLGRTAHPRSRLAGLFWGGTSSRHALGSLRVALTKLPAPVLACLDVTREAIGIAPEARYAVDVDQFIAHCGGAEIDALRGAVALYGGELFEDVGSDEAPEFSDWVFAERNRLRQLAHDAHVALAEQLYAEGRPDAARDVAEAWLKRDPASEAMHRLLIEWLARHSGNDRALAYFDVYRRALAVTRGAAPSAAMAALAERLRHPGREVREAPRALAPATAFFGRDDDLAALAESLADPACRLLTLHGMGGAGKTRLALALAERVAPSFGDGVFVVPLDSLASPDLFAQTLATACGLQPSGTAAPLELAIAFFRRRTALLVLDNLEHLLPAVGATTVTDQIAQLLAGTGPGLKLLCTSREPLLFQEEWIHPVEGLAFPRIAVKEGAAPGQKSGAGWREENAGSAPDDPRRYASVQLFAQRARQANARFSLEAELQGVMRICTLLEGLPLGLELAASWMDTSSCADIDAALRERAAALGNRHRNRAARHHSLGAVVAYSWTRLTDLQRTALAGLAVLAGEFSGEAAERIADADAATLAQLAAKALLAARPGGRWHLHEVVRQFAWEQCGAAPLQGGGEDRRTALCRKRDAYFMAWLGAARDRLAGSGEAEALAELDAESANLRAAWHSCAAKENTEALALAAPAWFDYLESRSFIAEGIAAAEIWVQAARRRAGVGAAAGALGYLGLFQRFGARTAQALETLDQAVATLPEDVPGELARIRAAKAFALFLLGRLAEAEAEAGAALALAERVGDAALEASACRVLGLAVLQSGRREAGRELQLRALALASAVGRPSLVAAAHNNLALAENHLGNYAAAEAGYENALTLWRQVHATVNIGRSMHNLGVVATRRGDHALALTRYEAALDMLRRAGDRNLIALNLMSTGDALLRLGRAADARAPALNALDMAERDGHMLPALDARIVLAQAATELGDHEDAARHLRIVLGSAGQHGFSNALADGVVSAARLVAAALPALRTQALGWARDVAAREEIGRGIREDARALLQANDVEETDTAVEARDIAALAAEALDRLDAQFA